MHALPSHTFLPTSRGWLSAAVSTTLIGLLLFEGAGWVRVVLWALLAWVALVTLALFLARGFRQPVLRITVAGRPGEPGEVRVRGWWPAPPLSEIQTWIAASELPGGTEIWARQSGGEVSIRSNLQGGDALEEALRRFLAPPRPSVQ